MGLLLLGQHLHILGDASCPRLGSLSVLDLVQDRVPVPAVELAEKRPSLLVLLKLPTQVLRHRGGTPRVVGGIPPAVGPCPPFFPQGRHLPLAPLYEIHG